jgi:hypothetical protein
MDHGYRVLGLIELAELLEVDKRTPYAWVYRDLMPAPDHPEVNGGKAWDRATILQWAARTGRLPESLEGDPAVADIERPDRRGGRKAKADRS